MALKKSGGSPNSFQQKDDVFTFPSVRRECIREASIDVWRSFRSLMEPGWETIILELTSVVVTGTHADGDIK